MSWRLIPILLLLLCCSLAWAVDGELRLLYVGNLAAGDEAAQAQVVSQVNALRAQAAQEHVPTLLVSPGVLLEENDTMQARTALTQLAALSPVAVTLGTCEARSTPELLRPLPWVSCTLTPNGVPVTATRVVTAGAIRVGVLGVTLVPGVMPDTALRKRLENEVTRLRRHCEVLVLLAPLDELQAPLLTALLEKVDVVVGSCGETETQTYGASALAPISADAPYCGQLDLAVRDNKLVCWRGGLIHALP